MEDILTVDNVSVTIDRADILRGIRFAVRPEEIVAIIGPNGSGKTMLIKAILGLVPHTGTVLMRGRPISGELHRIGYVPQRFDIDRNFPLTVEEFLGLSARLGHEKRVIAVLREVGMESARNALLGKLSGGQLQRVLIARAIMHIPELLILDEPTSGIDVEGVKDFYELISHINKEHHVTVLLISHEINVVYKFATSIVCLNKDLICYGVPEDVLTKEVLERLYGNETAIRKHPHEYVHYHA